MTKLNKIKCVYNPKFKMKRNSSVNYVIKTNIYQQPINTQKISNIMAVAILLHAASFIALCFVGGTLVG